jgi:hypothetical protein
LNRKRPAKGDKKSHTGNPTRGMIKIVNEGLTAKDFLGVLGVSAVKSFLK